MIQPDSEDILSLWRKPMCRKCGSLHLTYTGMCGIEIYAGEVCGMVTVPMGHYYCRNCNNTGVWNDGSED